MKITILIFKTNKKFNFNEISFFRGFIATEKKEHLLFHNHYSENTFYQRTPLIQYKIIDGNFAVLGTDKGADLIKNELLNMETININGKKYAVSLEIKNINFNLEISDDKFYTYSFLTPWMALNTNNYKKFLKNEFDFDQAISNNILEFLKISNFFADKKILSLCLVDKVNIIEKDTNFICFKGKFKTNVKLPDYISLGKRKSVGFGMIKNIK